MQCRRCQHENPSGVKFCGACGARLELLCPSCQTANPSTNAFCHECGHPLDNPASASPTSERPVGVAGPARMPSEAERRHLTVMFCDVVGSTELSTRLDPEVLRDVLRAYQEVCGRVIEPFQGHVAQHLGDGLLVYFGFPAAHEDDAARAVRAALGIVTAIEGLNARLEADQGLRLAVRLGIHTGLVVVGAIGSGRLQEELALHHDALGDRLGRGIVVEALRNGVAASRNFPVDTDGIRARPRNHRHSSVGRGALQDPAVLHPGACERLAWHHRGRDIQTSIDCP